MDSEPSEGAVSPEGTVEHGAGQDRAGQGMPVDMSRGLHRSVYGIRTNVRTAGKTPPSKGVSLGPMMRASQVKKSDSEMGPCRAKDGAWGSVAVSAESTGWASRIEPYRR